MGTRKHLNRADIEVDGEASAEEQSGTRPYASSWVDQLSDWVDKQRAPSWLYYLGLGLVVLLVQAIVEWVEGASPIGNLNFALVYLAAAAACMLALIPYLDKRANMALENMRPVLQTNEEAYQETLYRLTRLPALPTILASLATLAFVLLSEAIGEPYHLEALAPFPVSTTFLRIFYLICWSVFGVFLFHTFHQLSVINHVYTRHTRIDLFRPKPLYAFSNLAAITAGSLAMISYGWLLVNPSIDRTDPLVFMPMFVLLLFAFITFVWPQMGIHRLQVAEKERLLDEAAQRFVAATAELHRKMDGQDLEGIFELNMAMASVELELNAIRKTPTWPWEPEVARLLITAMALPLGLWLIQLILQRMLGQ